MSDAEDAGRRNASGVSPLHDAHVALGASFTDFAGWQMPLKYSSELAEHHAVRNSAGLFDLSHMGRVRVTGKVTDASFTGVSTQYLVVTSWGDEWTVFEQNRSADILRPGDEVVVHWASEHTFGLDVPPEA